VLRFVINKGLRDLRIDHLSEAGDLRLPTESLRCEQISIAVEFVL
jgi:hypothetical protein